MCVVVITIADFHSIKPKLRFCAGSNPACDVSEIRDGEDLWKNPEFMNELRRIEEEQQKHLTEILYFTNDTNKTYDSIKFKTIRNFGDAIKNCIISIDIANKFKDKIWWKKNYDRQKFKIYESY